MYNLVCEHCLEEVEVAEGEEGPEVCPRCGTRAWVGPTAPVPEKPSHLWEIDVLVSPDYRWAEKRDSEPGAPE